MKIAVVLGTRDEIIAGLPEIIMVYNSQDRISKLSLNHIFIEG